MPLLSRRTFASALPLGLLAGGLIGVGKAISATPDRAVTLATVTPLAQISIGRFTVTALADGYADMPYNFSPGASRVKSKRRPRSSSQPGKAGCAFSLTSISSMTANAVF